MESVKQCDVCGMELTKDSVHIHLDRIREPEPSLPDRLREYARQIHTPSIANDINEAATRLEGS